MAYPYDDFLASQYDDIGKKYRGLADMDYYNKRSSGVMSRPRDIGSLTSDANKFNASRNNEYLQALMAAKQMRREDDAMDLQKRSQAFQERQHYDNLAMGKKKLKHSISEDKLNRLFRDEEAKQSREIGQRSMGLSEKQASHNMFMDYEKHELNKKQFEQSRLNSAIENFIKIDAARNSQKLIANQISKEEYLENIRNDAQILNLDISALDDIIRETAGDTQALISDTQNFIENSYFNQSNLTEQRRQSMTNDRFRQQEIDLAKRQQAYAENMQKWNIGLNLAGSIGSTIFGGIRSLF